MLRWSDCGARRLRNRYQLAGSNSGAVPYYYIRIEPLPADQLGWEVRAGVHNSCAYRASLSSGEEIKSGQSCPGKMKQEEWLPELYDLRTLRFEVPRARHRLDLAAQLPAI